ncbi:phosphatase PAP2 family protein [Solirubrobacter sp. CPCC 204708]|uniref:Phosphatase PAP2 family protein n=1 Tax=Solirubrobacter deserti TaxID=2282478 RepID=A0ABT4RJ60_9ACTN|nr:phosphatase PAP2 family protein [Solirubrobacter deserti]MBE2320907.1 phosphatase PAP2 family protein [Solirubrobacter deserti]MDA0138543.1 phosphatase PAP2 family protein [Solirubrobacter deserti]
MLPDNTTLHPRRWLAAAALAAVLLVVTYWSAVRTTTGQRIENAALRGADQATEAARIAASDELSWITMSSFALISVVLVAAAWWRAGLRAAVGVGTVLAGSTVITETLKRVLPRPELISVTGNYTHNSFPSGHTTVAMSALFALLIVVPHRWRGIAVAVGSAYAVAIGAQTVTAKWHRLSDTVGADLVALAVACFVLAWLARGGQLQTVSRRRRLRVWTIGAALAVVTGLALAAGGIILALAEVPTTPDPVLDDNFYLASHSLALGCSGLAALVLWSALRQKQLGPSRRSDHPRSAA